MRFSVVVLCFMAVSINMILALEQPKQPPVAASNLAQVRGIQPETEENDWVDIQDDHSEHGNHNNGHGSNDCEWEEHNPKCPRKIPLSKKGPTQVPYEFENHKIVPDLLEQAPTQYVEVDYKNLSHHHCQPDLGNEISVCGTIHRPRLRWKCDPKKLYTIIFVDVNPYGLKHPKLGKDGILWLVVDIPGCRLSRAKTLYEYQAPTPVYGSIGPTRYVFLVYEQPAWEIDWSEVPKVESDSFSYRFFNCIDNLALKYELKLLGGNFFYSPFDPCMQAYGAAISAPPYLEHTRISAETPPNPYA